LRIGGSPADEIIYNIDRMCDKVGSYYGCLTISRWEAINNFASKVGFRLVFGLNARYGRNGKSSSEMDFANIEQLFNLTSSSR